MKNKNSVGKFSFLEPYGHAFPETKIERYWKQISGPYGLIRSRMMHYSPYSSMTYSPVKYTPEKFFLAKEFPTDEWILENFSVFVRGEMDEMPYTEMPEIPKVQDILEISDHIFNKFMLNSEFIEDYQQPNISSDSTSEEIAKEIFNILCDSKIGSKDNRKNNDESEFIKKVAQSIRDKDRLLFICPGMPFKDQNRFRVPFNASVPDMAEIAFIRKMCNLVSALYQNHAYGADIIILSDGILYGDIFNVDLESIKIYKERILYYRNKTNSQGSVSIICLKELIDRSSDDGWTWKLVDYIAERIKQFTAEEREEIMFTFKILTKGMKWNSNTRNTNPLFKDIDNAICWKFIMKDNDGDIPDEHKEAWLIFNENAKNAAYRYAAVNLMLRYTDLVKKFFPDSIRATIHPKKGQFSFAGENRAFSWNGVAWSKEWPKTIYDIKTVKFSDLSGEINQVVFEHTKLPCFYTAGTPNKNIDKAKNILHSYGWSIPNSQISGREFVTSDLQDFIGLGRDDEFFTWERKAQTDSYFESLLQFRISHYRKYSFGIHGIWENDRLIGQCGLQVRNEDSDEVEFVIFLGKEFTGKKYGSLLTDYVIKKCKEAGMDKLLGIVRADNEIGRSLMLKFGGQKEKTIKHYNHDGVVYSFNLK